MMNFFKNLKKFIIKFALQNYKNLTILKFNFFKKKNEKNKIKIIFY